MKIQNPTVGIIDLSDKELVFLFYGLNSLKEDIENLIHPMLNQFETKATVSKSWVRWLKENEKDLRNKLFGEMDIDQANMLNIFYQENGTEAKSEEIIGL